jgi:uncharacterized protein YbbK (DUF523 family)
LSGDVVRSISERSVPHLPTESTILSWPEFTPENPLCVLVSGCIAGRPCGADGSTYGEHPTPASLLALPNVRAIAFCPEDFAFGTPRATPDIHGGDGFDVLEGRARVLTDDGEDWTDGMVRAAGAMLELARQHEVRLALLMDISAACGSQVIYDGRRRLKMYRAGAGVAAAVLIRGGLSVVSQRDFKTLRMLFARLGRPDLAPPETIDHHETAWYRDYFRGS